ncbi:MAG: tetratricopeptide repeat protein [Chromatiales bacterium]|nr:tetratricopeptide repeat protein [Chromatiales bacterium]
MSLINQMLRDLDERDERLPSAEVINIFPTESYPEEHTNKRWWLVALALICLVAAGYYLWDSFANGRLARFSEITSEQPIVDKSDADIQSDSGQLLSTGAPPEQTVVAEDALTEEPVSTVEPEPQALTASADKDIGVTSQSILDASELALFSLSLRDRDMDLLADLSPVKAQPKKLVAESRVVKPTVVKPAAAQQTAEKEAASSVVLKPLTPLERANRFLALGHVVEAEQQLQQILDTEPERLEVRELLLSLLQQQGDRQRFVRVLAAGLQQSPDHLPFVLMQARHWLEQGKSDQAEQLLVKAQGIHTNQETLLSLLGAAYQQQQDYPKALTTYRRLLDLNPESARAWVGAAISLEATGDSHGATEAYRQALNLHSLPTALARYTQQRLQALSVGQ